MLNIHGRIILACILTLPWGIKVYAQPQGEGRVSLRGSIIETPCAIDTLSRDQSIDMGTTPVGIIARDGQGTARPFSIQLVNCTLIRRAPGQPDWHYFQATFDGERNGELFGVNGSVGGVALELADADGIIAHPGQALPLGRLSESTTRLNYNLRLVGDHNALHAGQFTSTLRFKMDYY